MLIMSDQCVNESTFCVIL